MTVAVSAGELPSHRIPHRNLAVPVESDPVPRSRVSYRASALVIVFGALAGIIYTYPLARHFTTAIPYGYAVPTPIGMPGLIPGDQLQFYYFLAITEDMVSGRVKPFTDPYEFSAPRPNPKPSFFFVPFSFLFVLLSPLGGATAYNLLVWLSFPATALAVFLLANRFGLRGPPMAIAVGALTVFPARIAGMAAGHPSGFVLFLVPLTFYFLERAWEERSAGAAAAAGVSLISLLVNEPHFAYFFGGLMPLWLILRFCRDSESSASDLRAAIAILGIAASGPAMALAAYCLRHNAELWNWIGLPAVFALLWLALTLVWRLTGEIRARSGDAAWLEEALSFWPLFGLWAYALQLITDVPHLGSAILSVVTVVFFIVKLPLWRAAYQLLRQDTSLRQTIGSFWTFVLALFVTMLVARYFKRSSIDLSAASAGRPLREVALFSPSATDFFGRSNTALDHQIYLGALLIPLVLCGLAVPAGRMLVTIAALFASLTLGVGAPEWLPFYTVSYQLVPYFRLIRQPTKFFGITMVALALAAGFGTQWLIQRVTVRWRSPLVAVLLFAILIDFSSTLPLGLSGLPTDNRAYAMIQERARGSNLLELPIWPGDSAFSSIYQYWTTRTKVAMVNGYNPAGRQDYVERVFRPLESMNLGELNEAQYRFVRDLGVRFVTLHGDAYPTRISAYSYRFALARMRRDPNLRMIAADRGVYLFELQQEDGYRPWDSRLSWPIGVFYEAEDLKIGSGKLVEDAGASGGAFVEGRGGAVPAPPIFYGPYRSFPVGSYRIHFRARGRGAVEIAGDRATRILASKRVDSAVFVDVSIDLEIDRDWNLEFRAWADPDRDLDIDWVSAEGINGLAAQAVERFEGEDLIALAGFEEESADASGGAYAKMVREASGTVVRDGPYRLLEPGRIRCRVRSRGEPFLLRIESPDGRHRFGQFRVPAHASWETTQFDFDLAERTPLCTRLVSEGGEGDVDFVELERQ